MEAVAAAGVVLLLLLPMPALLLRKKSKQSERFGQCTNICSESAVDLINDKSEGRIRDTIATNIQRLLPHPMHRDIGTVNKVLNYAVKEIKKFMEKIESSGIPNTKRCKKQRPIVQVHSFYVSSQVSLLLR